MTTNSRKAGSPGGAMIASQVEFWHGDVPGESVRRILHNLRFIADTYDLVVREEDEKRAIAALSASLSLWAAGKYGVNPAYGDG